MSPQRTWLAALALLFALPGCTSMGTGYGSSRSGDLRATLSWQSSDSRVGTMTAQLSTGETYSGRYFQVTQETRVDDLRPLWVGWNRRWRGWDYWGPGPWGPDWGPRFVTEYSGRVLANLQGPGDRHMRCRFQLMRPASGMSGGGEGRCQLPGGGVINTTFPPG
jgi:hypothetical protein